MKVVYLCLWLFFFSLTVFAEENYEPQGHEYSLKILGDVPLTMAVSSGKSSIGIIESTFGSTMFHHNNKGVSGKAVWVEGSVFDNEKLLAVYDDNEVLLGLWLETISIVNMQIKISFVLYDRYGRALGWSEKASLCTPRLKLMDSEGDELLSVDHKGRLLVSSAPFVDVTTSMMLAAAWLRMQHYTECRLATKSER